MSPTMPEIIVIFFHTFTIRPDIFKSLKHKQLYVKNSTKQRKRCSCYHFNYMRSPREPLKTQVSQVQHTYQIRSNGWLAATIESLRPSAEEQRSLSFKACQVYRSRVQEWSSLASGSCHHNTQQQLPKSVSMTAKKKDKIPPMYFSICNTVCLDFVNFQS